MKNTVLVVLSALTLAVGCGGSSGGSYGDPIDDATAESAGTQSVEGALDLTTLGANPANENAVGQSFAVYGAVSQMASIKQSHSTQPYSLNGGTLAAWDENCVTVSGNTATYDNCDSGDSTIDGTITGGDSSVDMDLTITTTQVEIHMTGDLSFSLTSLTGFIKYVTSIESSGMTIDTTYNADYDITLSDGCPVGGDVEVHYTVSSAAGMDVWAKAEFGPNCGDVTFY